MNLQLCNLARFPSMLIHKMCKTEQVGASQGWAVMARTLHDLPLTYQWP